MMVYLVTGATGNVGSLVTERLIARGVRPRVLVRDDGKARARYGETVDIYTGDLSDTAALRRAFAGADVVFLLNSGPDLAALDGLAADEAKRAEVKRLVKLSSYDARQENVGTGVWHAAAEAEIRASGIPYVFVQPSGFMSNALYWADSIKAEGMVRSATGEGRISFIHPRDIADVTVEALTQAEYVGQSLAITGPEALTYGQMGVLIGRAIGKEIRFEAMTPEEARALHTGSEPLDMAEAHLSIFRAIAEGKLAGVTDTVEKVLGRKAIRFEQWVLENAGAFQ